MAKRFGTPLAVDRLSNDLGLHKPPGFSQDWEYHVADRKRIHEFVNAYKRSPYGVDEKFLLMRIIIQSVDDALQNGEQIDRTLWDEVVGLLIRDSDIHDFTIDYWCLWDADDGGLGEESWFALTSKMREVYKAIHNELPKETH